MPLQVGDGVALRDDLLALHLPSWFLSGGMAAAAEIGVLVFQLVDAAPLILHAERRQTAR